MGGGSGGCRQLGAGRPLPCAPVPVRQWHRHLLQLLWPHGAVREEQQRQHQDRHGGVQVAEVAAGVAVRGLHDGQLQRDGGAGHEVGEAVHAPRGGGAKRGGAEAKEAGEEEGAEGDVQHARGCLRGQPGHEGEAVPREADHIDDLEGGGPAAVAQRPGDGGDEEHAGWKLRGEELGVAITRGLVAVLPEQAAEGAHEHDAAEHVRRAKGGQERKVGAAQLRPQAAAALLLLPLGALLTLQQRLLRALRVALLLCGRLAARGRLLGGAQHRSVGDP
mmetsp:Transcript_41821/g.107012  ORF Transcript_41821/g.107012 Transcript_41821/m.107012 type:complete len:276 (-) Transcript_41821:749-1576(-)